MQPSTRTLALAALAVTVAAAAPVAGTAAAAGESPAFENGIVQVPSGETAEVPVSVPEANGTVRVTIGSEATNFVAHATLVDADGDGNVTVAVDTGAAGTTDAASYLSVSDGDELTDATQETDRLSSPIAPAEYDLRLGPSDDPADEAALVVESASSSPPTNASGSTAAVDGDALTFVDPVVTADSGATADVTVALPGSNESTRLTLGSQEAGFLAHATVVDADGDGNVTVAVDTGTAGTTDAASYLSVSDGDELENATQETDRLSSPLDAGEYDLRLGSDDDTTAVGTLVLESASTPSETNASESATLDEAVVTAAGGETAAIPLAFADGTESARVTVGSEATNFVVRATVVDADGDGDATLELDTGTAGTTDAASYLRVSDGDELTDATQETDRLSSPLDAGEYDVRVGPAGDASDVGTLVLESASTPETDDGAETTDAPETTDGATTTDAPATPTLEATATPGDTQTASPGFGVLVGVLALLAVAGLARRR